MLFGGLLLLGVAGGVGVETPDTLVVSDAVATSERGTADSNETIEQYCSRCHSEQRQRGGLVLEGFDVENASEHADIAERMIKKLRAGMMPPSGARRPEEVVLSDLADELEID